MTRDEFQAELEELCVLAEQEIPLATTRIAHIRATGLASRLRRFQERLERPSQPLTAPD